MEYRLRNHAGVGEHFLVVVRRTDGLHDALADAGDDRLFGRPADEPLEFGSHRHAGLREELNTIAAHGIKELLPLPRVGQSITLGFTLVRTASSTSAPGEVDCRRGAPGQVQAGLVRRDHRGCGLRYVAACQEVRFQFAGR